MRPDCAIYAARTRLPPTKNNYMTYYMLNRTSQVGIAFLIGAKKGVGKIFTAKGPQARGFAGGILSSVRYSIVSSGGVGFVLVGIAIGIAVINFAGLLKPRKIDSEALIDLRDPLVKRFSKPSQFISDYQTLMRPVEPSAFEFGGSTYSTHI